MANVENFEYVFLGGGKGGKTLAMELVRAGKRVAVIERGMIGGSCTNVACTVSASGRPFINMGPVGDIVVPTKFFSGN